MDAKEILRIMVQNRFWIVLGIASLLPIIGYFVTAGAVKEATAAKVSEIDQAQQAAEGYRSGAVANGQYSEFTKPKINAIEEDVAKAHERLYKRQAPLLDWPEEIEPQLTAWGRDIPENVGPDEQDAVSYHLHEGLRRLRQGRLRTLRPLGSDRRGGPGRGPADGIPAPDRRIRPQ